MYIVPSRAGPVYISVWNLIIYVPAYILEINDCGPSAGTELNIDMVTYSIPVSLGRKWFVYRDISNIRGTKSQHFNVSRLVLQMALCNLL